MSGRKKRINKRFNKSYESLGEIREFDGVIVEMPRAAIRDTSDVEEIIETYVRIGLQNWEDSIQSDWEPPDQDREPQPGEVRARNGRVILQKQK